MIFPYTVTPLISCYGDLHGMDFFQLLLLVTPKGLLCRGKNRSIYIAQPSPIAPLTAIAPKAASQQHLTQPVSFDGHDKEICHWIVK